MWHYIIGSTAILRILLMSSKILLHTLFLLEILVFFFQFVLKIYEVSSGTPTRRNNSQPIFGSSILPTVVKQLMLPRRLLGSFLAFTQITSSHNHFKILFQIKIRY